jgi:hypothetical protein
MVSGKPPRRSKTTEEPVIIDLKATEVATEKSGEEAVVSAEPIKEPASEPPMTPTETPAPEAEAAIAPDTVVESPKTEPETEATAEHSQHDDKQPKDPDAELPLSTESETTEPLDQEQSSFGNNSSAFSSQTPTPEDEPAAPAHASTTNTSSLLAAGIAGGLIALIAAGSMQYAGIMPGMGSGNSDNVAALSAEVASLKQSIVKEQPVPDTSALEARLTQLENAQQNPSATVDPATISDLQTKLASANQTIEQLKSDVTGRIQSLTSGQTDLSDKLTTIQTKLDKPRDDIEVARAIAASALKTAADRGGPFLAELRTLGSIAPEDPAVKALEPYAATGTASRAELLQRFSGVADTILSTINQPAESANIGERLMASAMSIIKVRPVGNVAGDDPSAIVARIEDKIRNGDLKGASAEWETLPEAGRTVSASFKKALDARIAVEAQVSDALARSVAGRQG